jgi:hypothetical protein
MLSPEGVTLLEQKVRKYAREKAHAPKVTPKPQAAQIAKKDAELGELRSLMKAGTLSQAHGPGRAR